MGSKEQKAKTVKLRKGPEGEAQTFLFDHALRLLIRQGSKGAWELADQKFEFTGNEIIRRTSTGNSEE